MTNQNYIDLVKLNKCQNEVFLNVTRTIAHQEAHKKNDCNCLKEPDILRLFTSGVGGNLIQFNHVFKKLIKNYF